MDENDATLKLDFGHPSLSDTDHLLHNADAEVASA